MNAAEQHAVDRVVAGLRAIAAFAPVNTIEATVDEARRLVTELEEALSREAAREEEKVALYGEREHPPQDVVFELKARANDVAWDEADSVNDGLRMGVVILVREVLRAKLRRDVEVTAPFVTHRSAKTRRGYFKVARRIQRGLDERDQYRTGGS